jgi:hypothetical protein
MPGWLKLVGIGIREGIKVWTGFSPLAKAGLNDRGDAVIDKVSDTLNKVAEIVVITESIGVALSLDGPNKLQAATPLVTQLILKSDLMIGKKIDDQAMFTEGVQDMVNSVVKILNSIKDK